LKSDQGYRETLKDEKSLASFLRQMAKFDRRFCEAMAAGEDYTMKLEVHGNKGELLHCRVLSDEFDRPSGVEKRVERRNRQN